ncbi:MAG TPA: SprT family zinc-dependent metalloprotease [Rhizomicrobium sp.]|jgi:hypothetical protein|nr:SprT family zinc-dependent metalloprotease [Rhizomicrobium sp.]
MRWLVPRKPVKAPSRRELLKIDGRAVPVTLKLNPRARRLIVKVHPTTGEVTVVAPSRRALEHALDFARNEKDWIAGRLADVPPPVLLGIGKTIPFLGEAHLIVQGEGRPPVQVGMDDGKPVLRVSGREEHVSRRLTDFLKREVRAVLESRTFEYARHIAIFPKRITVRDTASRWGSCSSGQLLSFSWRLVFAPAHVLDYVVAHEVAHLKELNHGPRFWKLVREMVPDIETPQLWLRDHGAALHRYAPKIAPQE